MTASLKEKLQLKTGTILLLNPPSDDYADRLAKELKNVKIETAAHGSSESILLFVSSLAEAEKWVPRVVQTLEKDALLWIAYPKGSSGVKTDVNRDKLWPVAAKKGWRPVRQVAIDEVWSAMRFRPEAAHTSKAKKR